MSSSVSEVKNIFEMSREELLEYNQEKYLEFKEEYCNTNVPVDEIFQKLNVHKGDPTYRYINASRRGENLQRPVKLIDDEFEPTYQEYKRLFHESDLQIKDIYKKLGLKNYGKLTDYIHIRSKQDGLDGKARSWRINPHRKCLPEPTAEELKNYEEKYQEYRDAFMNTSLSLKQIHKKIGLGHTGPTWVYVKKRIKEDGLNGSERRKKISQEKKEDLEKLEELYQKFKKEFNETNKKMTTIYEELNIKRNSHEHNHIKKRCKEDGLNGCARRTQIIKDETGLKPLKKNQSRKQKENLFIDKNYSYFPEDILKRVEASQELLDKIFLERNVKESTRKGYLSSIGKWFEYTQDKYDNLQECIDFYIKEENERVPMRDRTIKKELLEFREFLVNNPHIKTRSSLNSYFSKLGAIFRHVGLEMPTLPRIKLDKGYVSTYADLPNETMIKTACEQSPLIVKSIILFMSSSGSAKAETLSLTVGMFIKGCQEYLNQPATPDNLDECIKELRGRHDIVPLIYLRRIKTDKYYHTCCSPEAAYMILEYLHTRHSIEWDDKLFLMTDSKLMSTFQRINDDNNWGYVGKYRRFRSHMLRKFHASNIGLSRDQVDNFQGRSKDMIQEAYFKQNPMELKDLYMTVMHRVMIYNNWGYGVTREELLNKTGPVGSKRLVTPGIIDVTNQLAKSKKKKKKDTETTSSHDSGGSIAQELLMYSELMEKGLITIAEFNQIKSKLLTNLLQ